MNPIAIAQSFGNIAYALEKTPEAAAQAYTEEVRKWLAILLDEAGEQDDTDPFEPDYDALAAQEPTSQFADSRESAGIPA